jgi:hypothetical protein
MAAVVDATQLHDATFEIPGAGVHDLVVLKRPGGNGRAWRLTWLEDALVLLSAVLAVWILFRLIPFQNSTKSFLQYFGHPDSSLTHRLILACGCLLALRVILGGLHHREERPPKPPSDAYDHDNLCNGANSETIHLKQDVHDLLTESDLRYPDPRSVAFATMHLTSPWLVTPRVGHTIAPAELYDDNTYIRRIDQVRDDQTYEQVAAIHRVEKGVTLTNFSVEVDGTEWSTVSLRDSQRLLVAVIHPMYRDLARDNRADNAFFSIARAVISDRKIHGTSSARCPECGKPLDLNGQQLTLKDYINALHDTLLLMNPNNEAEVDGFVYLLSELCRDQIIWCSLFVPGDGDTSPPWNRVKYRYVAPPTRRRNLSERARGALGMSPRKLTYILPSVRETHSYHLELSALDGLYLYDARIGLIESSPLLWRNRTAIKTDSARRVSLLVKGDSSPRLSITGLGDSRAHGYFRSVFRLGLADPKGESRSTVVPTLDVEFRERLPGILLPTLLLSCYIAFVVWTVGILYERIFRNTFGVPTVWGTLLFSIPALISAWFLTRFTASSISRVSLPVLFLIGWTLLNAVLTVVFAAIGIGRSTAFTWDVQAIRLWPFSTRIDLWAHPTWSATDICWTLLTFSATACVSVIALILLAKYARYIILRR